MLKYDFLFVLKSVIFVFIYIATLQIGKEKTHYLHTFGP